MQGKKTKNHIHTIYGLLVVSKVFQINNIHPYDFS